MRRRPTLFLILVALISFACGSDIVLRDSVKSPDGSIVADYFLNSGGGAAGAVGGVVSLRRATDEPSSKRWNSVFAGIDAEPVTMRWTSSREIEITYPKDATVTQASNSWRDVKIRYVVQ